MHTFVDEGCIKSTCLAVSPDGEIIAAGSDSGIVNIYDQSCMLSQTPSPVRAVGNLTTSVDNMSFNHDGRLLCISSRMIKNAVRMVLLLLLVSGFVTDFNADPRTFTHCLPKLPTPKYV